MAWYKGKTFVETLNEFANKQRIFQDFRMSVQDVYEMNGEKICVGNILASSVKKGDELKVYPYEKNVKVEKILSTNEIEVAKAPNAIGIILSGKNVCRGEILAKGKQPKILNNIKTVIFCIDILKNGKYDFCCSTQKIPCEVEIIEKMDINNFEQKKVGKVENGDIGRVWIHLKKPITVENFYDLPELGRFTLEKNNELMAGGIII